MKTRYSALQKLLALTLTLVLVIGLLPNVQLPAAAAIQAADRVADPSTLNEWENYFGPNVLSTEFAGGVWTDKSVFTNANAFRAEIAMDDPANNFLIALSAIAANQQIEGHASTPLDIMLTLDVSGSMDSNSKDTSMIAAANQAIGRLLSQNNSNRIGVVLYSGNSTTTQSAGTGTATVILPLDHYTTTSTATIGSGREQQTIPAYLSISNNSVSVASGVRNSSNQRPNTGSKNVSGGTYIQNGLYQAWTEFSQVTDTVIPAGNPQAGTRRTPIMILMSDGQPTLATANYNNVGTSQSGYGNGSESSTSWQTVFLTQLTAAWVKGKMQAHYGTTSKFYTLGLGTGNSNYATAVLNPSNAYNDLNTYWTRFFNNTVSNNGNVNVGSNRNQWNLYKDSNVKHSDYVDGYWLSANASGLLDAFNSIVADIELQAAGHVTLVDPIGEDMSGYITFTDELGALMEVKGLKGLVLGNQLFTGHELAKSLQESSMGTQQNPTSYGNEFIRTVCERLGIDNATDAQALVMAAYADGQLAYNAQTDEYSNYIGWYSDDAGTYLGFWDKDTGITADGAPAGTTWINKSYGYLGTAGSSDMMHVVVMLSTHIASGMQVVQFKIPASLIPKVTYQVELNGDDPTSMKSLTRKGADPLRLVYEVGMRSDLNAVNLEQKVEELPDGVHVHKNADGTYFFYTNLWGDEDHNINYNDPLGHMVAQSHFHPAEGNSRYYYTEDTPIYVKSGNSYSLYRGTSAPAGDGFYRAYHYYTASGYTTEYLPMSTYALNMAAANGRANDGCWYIPQGTIFQQINRFHMKKSLNLTETLEYYDYPVVLRQDNKYDVYAFLGNNGKITVAPAQGIKLTKAVTETADGAPNSFTFNITLSQAVANPSVTDPDGNAFTGSWSVNGNVITVELKADETVYITGLPTGVTYTVTEEESRYYSASSDNATGTVTAHHVSAVDFVNAPKGYGNLIVSKDVDHPYATVPQALTDKEFTINVTLSGPNTANKTFAVTGSDTISSITTDANGAFSVVLKDNGSLTVLDLPEDTTFVATETLDPANHKGFTMDANRSVLTGKIVKNDAVQAHVVNVYAPSEPVASIDVTGTKTLVDEGGTFDWDGKDFTIRLERYDPATGTYTTIGETKVTESDLTFTFKDALKLNAIGTYYYKVTEVIPADRLPGMSYDATAGRFEVRVTDNDVNGELEFEMYNVDTGDQITGSNYVYTFTKNFVNTHTTDATYVEFVVNKDVVDPHNTGASEAGFLFELSPFENGVVSTDSAYSVRTVMVGDQGQALFHIPITKTGTQQFILKEIAPLEVGKIPGMTYDTTEYLVTINTVAGENSELVPTVTFHKADGSDVAAEELVFTNEITLEPLTLTPYVTKQLNGRDPLSDREFTFRVLETDGSFVTPKAGGYSDTAYAGEGTVHFAPITITTAGTYYFRTWEEAGTTNGMTYDSTVYHITVNVTVNDNGELVADTSFVRVGSGPMTEQVTFTNTYVNNDTAELVLDGMKNLTGRTLITGEFQFKLEGPNGYTETVANRADGSFIFSPITYTAADIGTHTYTVTEINDGKGGVSYDSKTYTITVTVADNGAGELTVTAAGADSIAFNNTYASSPTNVSFSGTKTLYNTDLDANETLEGGEFTFELYATDGNYNIADGATPVATTTNNANGGFGFGLRYTKPGDYYYLLREKIEEAPGVGYDASAYQIKIVVFDTGLGSLNGHVDRIIKVGTNETTIAFGNYYTPAATEITITGEKSLLGRPLLDGEFDYSLYEANSSFSPSGLPLQTVTNEGKNFTFAPIAYEKSGTYYYVVKEDIPSAAIGNLYDGVGYDVSVFGITVTVTDNGQGQLEATYSVTKNGQPAELAFQNVYTVTDFTSFDLEGTKSWINTSDNSAKPMVGGEFTFEVYDANGVRITTAHNDANGNFTFRNIPVTSVGVHTFTVKEAATGLGGTGYDNRVYTVAVEAVDNLSGDLILTGDPVITLNGQNAQLKFENTYTVTQTTAQFRAQKVLENKQLTAEQFGFGLFALDADGNPHLLQSVQNLAGGGIVFDEITYTEPGDYHYIIKEAIPLDAVNNVKDGITYDDHICEISVSVGDNGDGTMTADVTYVTLPRFVNTYSVSGETTVDISGHKDLIGKNLVADQFSFVLYKGDQELAAVKNAASGRFVFEDVLLDSVGEHVFTVKEVKGDLGSITYDETVYTVIVAVTDNGIGGLTAAAPVVMLNNVATDLVFTNRYVNNGTGSVSVGGIKVFTQDGQTKPIGPNQFSFTLSGPNVSETVFANTDGSFSFTDLHYTAQDIGNTYTYTVQEVIPASANSAHTKDGIVYDPTVYTFSVQIEDNNEGGITIIKRMNRQEISGDVQVQFSNTYSIQGSGFITVGGSKTYTDNRTHAALPFGAGEFSFNLKGHGIDQTVTNAASGDFTFSPIIYTKDDISDTPYVYTVSEVKGNKDYIGYDATVFTVEVMVEDDGKGGLEITKTLKKAGKAVDSIDFNNTYNIIDQAVVPVSGTKKYNKPLQGGDFSFNLFGREVDETVKNDKYGNFSFTALTYNSADIGKTFTYIVRELIPEGAVKQADGTYFKDGVTYDPDVYTLKISVADNGQGGLKVIKTLNNVGVNNVHVVFNNYYDITCTAKLELTGTKELTGKTMHDGDFSFGLYDASGKPVTDPVTNKDGKFTISLEFNKAQLPASPFTYTLKEIIPTEAVKNADGTYTLDGITYDTKAYTVKVAIADDGKGGLNLAHTVNGSADTAISFTNIYKAQPAKLVLEATKSYNKPLKGDDFSFQLEGAIGSTQITQVKKNDKDGKILFDELSFSEAGTYTFRVTEVNKILGFIEYDESVYDVAVTVTDNGKGQLEIGNLAVNTVKDGKISFTNTYVIDGVGSVTIDGLKLYNKELNGGEFAFNLSGHGINETVTNGKDGKFTFSQLTYDKDDVGNTYTYTVSESKGGKDYISYDETLYTVEVTVADNEEGGLKITKVIKKAGTAVDAITFTNTYTVIGTGFAEISGLKLYNKDLNGGEFAFNLSGNGINETVTNNAEGKFSFSKIRYDKDDIGQTYTYIVTEVKGDKAYITYDETLYIVEVTVADNGEGGLTVKQTYKKGQSVADAITFTNTYTNNGTGSVVIGGIKIYNKDLYGDDFSFILSQILADRTEKLEEVKNAKDGTFSFTDLTYTSADIGNTYTYTMQESIPADAVKQSDGTYLKDGITYDPDVYTITVTVEDNGEGGLKITKKLGLTETDEIVTEFNNAYDITGTAKLELTGTKELTGGKPLADGDFSFGLYDAEGNLVGKPVTNADGKFTFTVEYDKNSICAEPIVYTVKEIIPAEATRNEDGTYTLNHITYDAAVYQVEVTVADNGQGGIDVDYKLVNAEAITFKNVYTPANHIVNLNVQKNIVSKTEDTISAEGFQFELYYQDVLLATYSSDAEGKASFPVAFTAKDIGQTFNFQIKEVNTYATGVTYDTTVHEITVKIGQNEDGTIHAYVNDQLTDTVTVAFTNTYAKPVTPNTGDTSNLALLFVLLLVSGTGMVTIVADRKRKRA